MSTDSRPVPTGEPLLDRVARAVQDIDEGASDAPGLWHVTSEDPEVARQWGHSESVDPDNVGDIADEGLGHRG